MVTDPPPDDEDPERDRGDGSVDEDPIEEVDFWEEVGETREPQEGDLSGGSDGLEVPDSGGADIEIDDGGPPEDDALPEAGERWPELQEEDEADDPAPPTREAPDREADGPADPGPPERDGPDRPSSEIDAEERLSGGGPPGIDLGLGPDEPREEPDGPPADEAETSTPPSPEAGPDEPDTEAGPDEPGPRPTAEAREEPDADEPTDPAAGEPAGTEVVTEPDPEPQAEEAEAPATEVVTEPEPEGEEAPDIPRLRERGPVEAGAHPRADVEEAEGPCHLCAAEGEEPPEGRHTCVSCERPACSSHFWVMFALCEGCATEEQIRKLRGERTGDDWSQFLEIKWVD